MWQDCHFLTETRSILKDVYNQKVTVFTVFDFFVHKSAESAVLSKWPFCSKTRVNSIQT